MKATAAVLADGNPKFELAEIELSACRPDELLVEVAAVGICHTDLAVRDGDMTLPPRPVILGHEGAGRVISTGSHVRKVGPGDAVVMSFSSCGGCAFCRNSARARCEQFLSLNVRGCRADGSFVHSRNGQAIHGSFFGQSSFSTHAIVPERNVVKVPRDLPLELLGPLGCSIQTGAGTVLNHPRGHDGATLAIFGAGAVGLSALMAARIAGCARAIVVDLHDARLSLAADLGATDVINARNTEVSAALRQISSRGIDHAIVATGAPAAIADAFGSIRQGGAISLLGLPPRDAQVTVPVAALMAGELRTVIEGDSEPDTFIPALIDHYRCGRFPFDRLISFYPFSDINRAAEDLNTGRTLKPVLRIMEP